MFAILAHIRPLDLRTNTRVDVRVASTAIPAAQGLGGVTWESAMTRRPKASIELFAMDLSPGTRAAQADFEISLEGIQELDSYALHWKGAPVTIYRADDLRWPATVEFDGYVSDPKRNLNTDRMTLNCAVLLRYDKPLLTKEFNDTNLIFDADKRTTLVPAGFGTCLNVEPVLFDSVRNFYMIDGYGNLLGVDWVGEALSDLGPPMANYPDYQSLAAAEAAGSIIPGRWATCIAEGILALGAPPVGVITCHVRLGFGMTGALIRRATLGHAGVPADKVEQSSLDALDAAVPYPIHYWTADQIQVNDLVEALAAACNASPIITMQGRLAVLRPFGGPTIGSFVRRGFSEPAITDWQSNDVVTPYWRVTARVARPVRVMALDEVNYEDDLIDRGLYDNGEVYRKGNIVWLKNKSQWLYINDIPHTGHPPPSDGADAGDVLADEYWQLMAPAPGAEDLIYVGGQTVEEMKPRQPGADVTGDNTANDTNNIGGIPADQFIARVVGLEDILAPTGEVQAAFDAIAEQMGFVTTDLDTLQAQMAGESESYLKSQITVAAGIGSAAAESVSTLSAQVFGAGGLSATVTQQSGVLASISGRTLAYWQIETGVGSGTDAFITARAETTAGQPVTSSVAIGADTFMVYNRVSGEYLKTFEASGGNVRIYGNLQLDGSVNTRNLIDNAVSESSFNVLELYGASVGGDDDNVWRNFAYGGAILQATFNNPTGGSDASAIFIATLVGRRTGGDNDRISIRMIRNDGVVLSPAEHTDIIFRGSGNEISTLPFYDASPNVGSNTYTLQTKNLEGHPAWQRGIIIPLRLSK